MRIALISVFSIPCGIATYNANLAQGLSKFCDLKIFAEDCNFPDTEEIKYCWNRNEHAKLRLIDAVEEFNPDVVLFSHEYGFFPKAYQFTSLVSYFKWKKYKVATIFHSIYNHLDKTVQEASSPLIFVHSEGGKNCLIKKGINENVVSIIPHGSQFLTNDNKLLDKLWDTWNAPTIFQPGFLFNYKGHLRMLDVIAKIKQKYPDIQYIIQGSENPKNQEEHDRVYEEILHRAKELDLLPNLTVNRGFSSFEVLLSHIRTVSCVVLPYIDNGDHSVYATSGMARIVLGTKTPLVVSKVPLFDDLVGKDVCYFARNDQELEEKISYILDNRGNTDYEENRVDFIKKTSWEAVAENLVSLLK